MPSLCFRAAVGPPIVLLICSLAVGSFAADPLPTQSEVCASFTAGVGFFDGYFEFRTPNYPRLGYPRSCDCIKVIKAERADQIIELDFRGEFHIEESSGCVSDYLEIRDGPYGYSPLLSNRNGGSSNGRYCGDKPPSQRIKSSGRYLWLRFKSDEVIEHRGARAVYRFVQYAAPHEVKQECVLELHLSVGQQEVVLTRQIREIFPPNYQAEPTTPVDCSVDAGSPDDTQVLISLESLQVRRDDLCKQQAVYVYDGFTVDLRRDFALCRTLEPMTWRYLASSGRAVIHVTSKDTYLIPKFLVVFTVIKKGPCQASTEFDCGSNQCIDSRLVCNSHANCPDARDELNCFRPVTHSHEAPEIEDKSDKMDPAPAEKKHEEVPYHPIILGSIGLVFVALTAACCCVTLRRRIREGRRQGAAEAALEPADRFDNHLEEDFVAEQNQWQQQQQQQQTNFPPIQTILLGENHSHSLPPPPPPPLPPLPCQNGFTRCSLAALQHSCNSSSNHQHKPDALVDAEKFLSPSSDSRSSPIADVLAADGSAMRASHLVAAVPGPGPQGPQRLRQPQANTRRIKLVFQA